MYNSATNKDTTVTFDAAVMNETEPTGPREGAAAEPGLILLVEDDFILRGALATVLVSEGYKVESAANGLDALERLARPPKPALIVLDIMLPYMDGLEFRTVQRATPAIADIPVIVLTAIGVEPEAAAELRLDQPLFKPVDRSRMLQAIRRHCPPRMA
jgi:CheY-like chemotaxis protein